VKGHRDINFIIQEQKSLLVFHLSRHYSKCFVSSSLRRLGRKPIFLENMQHRETALRNVEGLCFEVSSFSGVEKVDQFASRPDPVAGSGFVGMQSTLASSVSGRFVVQGARLIQHTYHAALFPIIHYGSHTSFGFYHHLFSHPLPAWLQYPLELVRIFIQEILLFSLHRSNNISNHTVNSYSITALRRAPLAQLPTVQKEVLTAN